MRASLLICLVFIACLAGCGGSATDPTTSSEPDVAAPSVGQTDTPAVAEQQVPTEPAVSAAQPLEVDPGIVESPEMTQEIAPPEAEPLAIPDATPAAPEPSETASPDAQRIKADVGVGAKGRGLDKFQGGVLVTPAKAYFTLRERAIFQVQIPQAMQMYQALHGTAPESHDQFMKEIIQANQIQLPELPAEQRYVYDPQAKELMVERPTR
ncbi:MAG: hypothetical protein EA424_18445 [Planctomycetaceae bacterium]|nr:MAG: hypothetical protein EA424_18445 [Planctomycetaceae bacterium]